MSYLYSATRPKALLGVVSPEQAVAPVDVPDFDIVNDLP
jgi:hypothetical protein